MTLARLLDLSGRVALVAGGSRGLGLQRAEVPGELGAKIVITARKADELAQAKDKTAGLAPLKGTGSRKDLKGLTALQASDAGAFITGQIIAVDGGLTAVF